MLRESEMSDSFELKLRLQGGTYDDRGMKSRTRMQSRERGRAGGADGSGTPLDNPDEF